MIAQTETEAQLAALLVWYREMGVDMAVSDAPVNWLEQGDTPPRRLGSPHSNTPARVAPPAAAAGRATTESAAEPSHREYSGDTARRNDREPRRFPTAAPDTSELNARSLARDAATLANLEQAVRGFDGCGLKTTAKTTCVYRGAATARLAVIGEAPGREEDQEGRPFVGPAGQLLDKMLAAIGLDESHVHITNVVYWRPPGNRTPTPQEALICRPFLERQIELVAPHAVLLLGGAAAKAILDVPEGIMRVRGKWHDVMFGAHAVKAIATLHPAYLLRTPIAKRLAWRDLLAVKAALAGSG